MPHLIFLSGLPATGKSTSGKLPQFDASTNIHTIDTSNLKPAAIAQTMFKFLK